MEKPQRYHGGTEIREKHENTIDQASCLASPNTKAHFLGAGRSSAQGEGASRRIYQDGITGDVGGGSAEYGLSAGRQGRPFLLFQQRKKCSGCGWMQPAIPLVQHEKLRMLFYNRILHRLH